MKTKITHSFYHNKLYTRLIKKIKPREVTIMGVLVPVDPGVVTILDNGKERQVPTCVLEDCPNINFEALMTEEQKETSGTDDFLWGSAYNVSDRTLVPLKECPMSEKQSIRELMFGKREPNAPSSDYRGGSPAMPVEQPLPQQTPWHGITNPQNEATAWIIECDVIDQRLLYIAKTNDIKEVKDALIEMLKTECAGECDDFWSDTLYEPEYDSAGDEIEQDFPGIEVIRDDILNACAFDKIAIGKVHFMEEL